MLKVDQFHIWLAIWYPTRLSTWRSCGSAAAQLQWPPLSSNKTLTVIRKMRECCLFENEDDIKSQQTARAPSVPPVDRPCGKQAHCRQQSGPASGCRVKGGKGGGAVIGWGWLLPQDFTGPESRGHLVGCCCSLILLPPIGRSFHSGLDLYISGFEQPVFVVSYVFVKSVAWHTCPFLHINISLGRKWGNTAAIYHHLSAMAAVQFHQLYAIQCSCFHFSTQELWCPWHISKLFRWQTIPCPVVESAPEARVPRRWNWPERFWI